MLPTDRHPEITPAMIEAGVKILRERGLLSDSKQRASDLAVSLLRTKLIRLC
jgi:hypothetical protein